jgi:hypothetical protein
MGPDVGEAPGHYINMGFRQALGSHAVAYFPFPFPFLHFFISAFTFFFPPFAWRAGSVVSYNPLLLAPRIALQ